MTMEKQRLEDVHPMKNEYVHYHVGLREGSLIVVVQVLTTPTGDRQMLFYQLYDRCHYIWGIGTAASTYQGGTGLAQ